MSDEKACAGCAKGYYGVGESCFLCPDSPAVQYVVMTALFLAVVWWTMRLADAKAVYDSITARHLKTPDDKHLILHARAMREFPENGIVDRLFWFGTDDMLPDGLTKGSVDLEALIRRCLEGIWSLRNEQAVSWRFKEHREEVMALCYQYGLL